MVLSLVQSNLDRNAPQQYKLWHQIQPTVGSLVTYFTFENQSALILGQNVVANFGLGDNLP